MGLMTVHPSARIGVAAVTIWLQMYRVQKNTEFPGHDIALLILLSRPKLISQFDFAINWPRLSGAGAV